MNEVVEMLVKAREILWERGWTKNFYMRKSTGEVCGLGALALSVSATLKATTMDFPAGGFEKWEAARNALEVAAGTDWFPRWNDEPGRTFDEVIDLFDRAIKSLESPE